MRRALLFLFVIGASVAFFVALRPIRLGVVLFFILLAAGVFSAMKQMRDLKHEQSDRRMLRRVDACLTAWAEDGDWNPLLSARLKSIVKEYPR